VWDPYDSRLRSPDSRADRSYAYDRGREYDRDRAHENARAYARGNAYVYVHEYAHENVHGNAPKRAREYAHAHDRSNVHGSDLHFQYDENDIPFLYNLLLNLFYQIYCIMCTVIFQANILNTFIRIIHKWEYKKREEPALFPNQFIFAPNPSEQL